MSRPRVFVSSTFYDLKYIRSSLDGFIESLGFDTILSEKGNIAFEHHASLDYSCYREVSTADIFVLIIGGRYGSAASGEVSSSQDEVYKEYESVTRREHAEAVTRDIPIYILVESAVYYEYRTYLMNKANKDVKYAHVDSPNVFQFLDEILHLQRNNPVQPFERFTDISDWLKEQWAGLFRELLHGKSNQQRLTTLTGEVNALREVSNTLKTYLERLIKDEKTPDAEAFIKAENTRLEEAKLEKDLSELHLFQWLSAITGKRLDVQTFHRLLMEAEDVTQFAKEIGKVVDSECIASQVRRTIEQGQEAYMDVQTARKLVGKEPLQGEIADGERESVM